MRRIGYDSQPRWRILPKNEAAVSDADFEFSQSAFSAAAKQLGIKPDALQGGLWFAEKSLWAAQGWARLDLGDFRAEMRKLPLLRQGIAQRLTTTAKSARVKPMQQAQFSPGEETWSEMMNRVHITARKNANDPVYLGYKRGDGSTDKELMDEEIRHERANKANAAIEPRNIRQ